MRFYIFRIVLAIPFFLLLSCGKKNSATSDQIRRRPTAKESFKIDEKYQSRAKTNVSTRKSNKESTMTEVYGEMMGKKNVGKKKKKMVYANYGNQLIEQRKREAVLQAQEMKKNPQYNNPAFFGEKKNPRKKNGKIRKKFAKPPYVMNPEFNKPKNKKGPSKNKTKKKKK